MRALRLLVACVCARALHRTRALQLVACVCVACVIAYAFAAVGCVRMRALHVCVRASCSVTYHGDEREAQEDRLQPGHRVLQSEKRRRAGIYFRAGHTQHIAHTHTHTDETTKKGFLLLRVVQECFINTGHFNLYASADWSEILALTHITSQPHPHPRWLCVCFVKLGHMHACVSLPRASQPELIDRPGRQTRDGVGGKVDVFEVLEPRERPDHAETGVVHEAHVDDREPFQLAEPREHTRERVGVGRAHQSVRDGQGAVGERGVLQSVQDRLGGRFEALVQANLGFRGEKKRMRNVNPGAG